MILLQGYFFYVTHNAHLQSELLTGRGGGWVGENSNFYTTVLLEPPCALAICTSTNYRASVCLSHVYQLELPYALVMYTNWSLRIPESF